jgi:hypothetical protein
LQCDIPLIASCSPPITPAREAETAEADAADAPADAEQDQYSVASRRIPPPQPQRLTASLWGAVVRQQAETVAVVAAVAPIPL